MVRPLGPPGRYPACDGDVWAERGQGRPRDGDGAWLVVRGDAGVVGGPEHAAHGHAVLGGPRPAERGLLAPVADGRGRSRGRRRGGGGVAGRGPSSPAVRHLDAEAPAAWVRRPGAGAALTGTRARAQAPAGEGGAASFRNADRYARWLARALSGMPIAPRIGMNWMPIARSRRARRARRIRNDRSLGIERR